MTYCSKCGNKNKENSEFCSKCGTPLTESTKKYEKDDVCVCEGNNNRNPLVPVFWGIVVILIGLWIVYQFVIPSEYFPPWLQEFNICSLIFLIIAIAIILTGIRIMTKK